MSFSARLVALFAILLATGAFAQGVPVAGIDYRELKDPQPTESPGSIEVVEFFWYRCPHCYALEPALETWLAKQPADVRFRRVPVIFGDHWEIDARILYALEAIGESNRLHRPLLDAIHEQGGKKLNDKAYLKWVADWLLGQRVDMRRYNDAVNSPAVREKVKQAAEMTRVYGVEGTPTFAVQGRYIVSPPPGERRAILVITEHLIRQSQAQLARR
jgi:thiol:disulfide interchange protein DsbA